MLKVRKPRIAVKEQSILLDIRRQIVEGKFGPGSQLPKRDELEQMFNVSPLTLRRALDSLAADGFIYAKTGQGTFVTNDPPHLTHYGVVFPADPGVKEAWSNFYEAMNNEALGIQRAKARKLSIYYGLEHPARHESRDKLIADVQSHRLAGLIFASPPFHFDGTPLLEEPGMARVAFGGFKQVPGIWLDQNTMIDKAVHHFKQRGRRKIAMLIGSVDINSDFVRAFQGALDANGMETRSYWQQSVAPAAAPWAKNVVEMICNPGQSDRPDGLFIVDDNLVPHATAGLLSSGMRVPDEMDVVAHCNFPWPTASMVPAKRIGFDARRALAQAIDLIDRQRRGETVPLESTSVALLDDEVN